MRLIDADTLIHELNNSHYPGAPYVDAGISIAIGKVCDAPTIEPERKKGKWIDGKCDQCGCHAPYWSMSTTYYKSNYCPECGADMRGEQG